jgi:hypothetical protein
MSYDSRIFALPVFDSFVFACMFRRFYELHVIRISATFVGCWLQILRVCGLFVCVCLAESSNAYGTQHSSSVSDNRNGSDARAEM